MPEYINKQQILEKAKQHQNSPFAASLIIAEIEKADEDLVKCKDCKHAKFYNCKNDACYKRIICEYQIGTDDENFYCSYGERRDNNG